MAAGDNPDRMTSESSFAALCGASPTGAPGGRTVRHRPDRGGDRRANRALHVIAIHRMRTDPRTVAYAERRRAEGLSDRETGRCPGRHVASEAHGLPAHPDEVPVEGAGPELREARLSVGISQKAAAAALGITAPALCDFELGHHQFRELAIRYRKWVEDGFPAEVTKTASAS